MAHQLDTVIVGTKYRGALAVQIVAGLPRGTKLRLIREPHNEHDKDAVAIFWQNYHLGYIPRSDHGELSRIFSGRRPSELVAEVTFEAIIAGSEIKFAPKIRVKLGDGNADNS